MVKISAWETVLNLENDIDDKRMKIKKYVNFDTSNFENEMLKFDWDCKAHA